MEEVATGTNHGASKNVPKIHTVEEGCECLEAAQLIELDDTLDVNTLAGTLV